MKALSDVLLERYATAEENHRRLMTLRPFPAETVKSLKNYYRIGLTYSSNALEGNSLTESETKIVLEYGLTVEGKPLRDYIAALEAAHRDDTEFKKLIAACVIETQNDLLRLLK